MTTPDQIRFDLRTSRISCPRRKERIRCRTGPEAVGSTNEKIPVAGSHAQLARLLTLSEPPRYIRAPEGPILDPFTSAIAPLSTRLPRT